MSATTHVGVEMHASARAEPAVDVTAVEIDPIAALISGGQHRDAVAACARTHGPILGRLAMALLGSQADADEAVQEALLRAHRGMATFRGEGSVKAWLCGIARHVCAHVLETRRRGRELLEVVPSDAEGRDELAARMRARAVRAALAELKPSEREALVLRYVADLSHREIAEACDVDEAAARKRVSRALVRLREALGSSEGMS
jgi:RNA polymerase sigma-70 factor, ECF subfamily